MDLTKALTLVKTAKDDPCALATLEALIVDAIGIESAKSAGMASIRRVLKKIITRANRNNPLQPTLHGAWMKDNKQYVSDGWVLVELNTPVPGLPQLTDEVEPWNAAPAFMGAEDYTEEVPLGPDIKVAYTQAVAAARSNRVELASLYKLGRSYYQLLLLRDALEALGPGTVARCKPKPNRPCILTSPRGRALIMHVYTKEDT